MESAQADPIAPAEEQAKQEGQAAAVVAHAQEGQGLANSESDMVAAENSGNGGVGGVLAAVMSSSTEPAKPAGAIPATEEAAAAPDSAGVSNDAVVESKPEAAVTAAPPPPEQLTTPAKPAKVVRPALRGLLSRCPKGMVSWVGKWGMDDSAFEGGIVSPFSYKRVQVQVDQSSNTLSESHLLSGEHPGSDALSNATYTGHFNIIMNGRSKKIPEKNLLFEFAQDDKLPDGHVRVKGSGVNQFGAYSLEGWLVLTTGELNVYREYKPVPVGSLPPKSGGKKAAVPRVAKPKAVSLPIRRREPAATLPPAAAAEPRTSRLRRAPSHLVEDMLDGVEAEDMLKLKNIVREIKRNDRDGWFGAPVDASALGLRNYHKVITSPMDLGTIMIKFENKEYTAITDAISDVRLTFNNAMTYNPEANGVHQAAKRLLAMFESKLPQLAAIKQENARKRKSELALKSAALKRQKSKSTVFGSDSEDSEDSSDSDDEKPRKKATPKRANSSKRKKSRGGGGGDSMPVGEVASLQKQLKMLQNQIKEMNQLQMTAIQRQMSMTSEALQAADHISAPPPKKQQKPRPSEPRPLSYQEKRQLGNDIRKLPTEYLQGVVQIIEESGAQLQEDEDGELEIDIEVLDAPALRKMQKYVKKKLQKVRSTV